jgi:hypothetical protein
MNKDEKIEVIDGIVETLVKGLEWSGTYSYCTGWPCCPVCKGIKPGYGVNENGAPDNTGHRDTCKMKLALEEFE